MWSNVIVWLVVLLCLLTSSFSVAWGDDTILLQPKWKQGDKAQYEWIKIKYQTKDGQRTKLGESHTDLLIEVLRADAKGFEIGWTFAESKFEAKSKEAKALVSRVTDPFKGLRIIYELEDDGAFVHVKNWDEVKKRGILLVENMRDLYKTAGKDQKSIDAAMVGVQTMFESRSQFEAIGCRDAQLFLMINGITIASNDPFEYPDILPNPLGGPPFPCVIKYVLKSLDKEKQLATVERTQRFNEKSTQAVLEKTFEGMAKRMGKPMTEADKANLKDLSIKDDAQIIVDLQTGWIRSLSHKRTSSIQGIVQEDVTVVTRK